MINGSTESGKEKVSASTRTDQSTLAHGLKANDMVMVLSHTKIVQSTMESGKMIRNTEMEY